MLVLLDLLGASNPELHNFYPETSLWFDTMQQSERQMISSNLWSGSRNYFRSAPSDNRIEDDHLPFLHRGVSIMHLIAAPFPKEWHTEADNKKALDFDAIENLNKVFRIFVARYLNLSASPA